MWNDPRLTFNLTCSLNIQGNQVDSIWLPDVYFFNDKEVWWGRYEFPKILLLKSFVHDVTRKNKVLTISPDGSIFYRVRITLLLFCPLKLARYPMDIQNCSLEIESCKLGLMVFRSIVNRLF